MIAIDLGSNTLRVTKLDCRSRVFTDTYEKIVKTADGLTHTGNIDRAAVDRIIDAIDEAKREIDFASDRVRAVTTEALRQAENSEAVLQRIFKETGVHFEIISGEMEAALTLMAVRFRLAQLHYTAEKFVLVDIGGGSTELIFHYGEKSVSKSFPIGIVTMAQRYTHLDEMESHIAEEMDAVRQFCAKLYAQEGRVDRFIATAGTPTTVAAMKHGLTYASYDAGKVNGTTLTWQELNTFLTKLLAMPFDMRETVVGTGRSDLIAAGILIFKELYRIVECQSSLVIDDGLREGVALQGCLS